MHDEVEEFTLDKCDGLASLAFNMNLFASKGLWYGFQTIVSESVRL
jgi:hypothetical protein